MQQPRLQLLHTFVHAIVSILQSHLKCKAVIFLLFITKDYKKNAKNYKKSAFMLHYYLFIYVFQAEEDKYIS